MEVQSRLLDIRGSAEYLGCKVYTIRDLIWKGELRYVPLGRKHMVDRTDLDALIAARKRREGP
jgi:excisionase family DNA binding protein